MKFCPNCGSQIPDEAGFCPNCGTAGEAAAAPVAKEAPVINSVPPVSNGQPNGFEAAPQQPEYQAPPQPEYQAPPQQPSYQTPPPANPYSATQTPYQQASQPSPAFQQPAPPQGNPYGAPQPLGNYPPAAVPQEEKASIGLAILSFFIPIVGIILFFVKKKERPKTAKACLIGALISVALGIIFSIIFTIAAGKLVMDAAPELTTSYVDDNGGGENTTSTSDSTDQTGNSDYQMGEGSAVVWTDSIDSSWIKVTVPVKNTGKKNLYLNTCTIDVEDGSGALQQSITYVSGFPQIIQPGETGYFYEETLYTGSSTDGLKVIPHAQVEETDLAPVRYDVSEVTVKDDGYGSVAITGRVENTSEEASDNIYVVVNLYDKSGNMICRVYTILSEELAPGEKIGFDTSTYAFDVAAGDVGSYDVYAYPYQYSF